MRRTKALVGVFLTACNVVAGRPVAAQEAASTTILPGSRLRISADSLGTRAVEGAAAGFEDGLLVLELGLGRAPLRIDLANVSRVELRTKESTRRRGARRGAAAGALGFLLLVAATDGCGGSEIIKAYTYAGVNSDEWCYGTALAFGGAVGALIGSAVSHGDRWEALPLDEARRRSNFTGPGLRWQVAARGRGVGLSLSVGF